MKKERWLVIGTDERLKVLAKKLSNDIESVYYKCLSSWTAELNQIVTEFKPNVIVLPIQPLKIEVPYITGINNVYFFAGKLNEKWREILKNNEVFFYLEDESFIWQNASLTAEAFVSIFYSTKQAIKGKKFIVTGFGRVAKMIGHMIKNIGGEVCIAVRSDIQLNEAKAFRYEAIYLSEIINTDGDFIINTIPAKWLDEELNKQIKLPIYDLASYPGCLADGVKRKNYELLPALPGKCFPNDAASVLYTTMLEQLRRRDACLKENESV